MFFKLRRNNPQPYETIWCLMGVSAKMGPAAVTNGKKTKGREKSFNIKLQSSGVIFLLLPLWEASQ